MAGSPTKAPRGEMAALWMFAAVALANDQVKKFVDRQGIKQVIVVPKRLVNIVI